MLVTNFNVKYRLYTIITTMYQLFDVGRIHPVREREFRALKSSVDYIEDKMPDAMGFKSQKELIGFALTEIGAGHLLELGVFRGGTALKRGITYTYLGFARQQVALRVDAVNHASS